MNLSYNWLTELIDLSLSPEETAEKLTLIGLEVEEVRPYGTSLEGVVVGKVEEVRDHPNADRLRICRVDAGAGEPRQIICGADNVAAGQAVPVATVGTTLPVTDEKGEYLTIRKAKIRGESSEGMICAEDELGLGTGHEGIMVLDTSAAPGTPLREVLDLYTDTVIDIAITPNRPDATSHVGVARDLAAALDLDFELPYAADFSEAEPLEKFDISIKNPEKCHRYVGKAVSGVTVGESPAWLKNRLLALGVRPVNNVVDATNWVMLETGQPLHAFDRGQLRGDAIVVRDYEEAVTFETLDHVKRNCAPGTLFICDGEAPVAIAGVMGGVDSEVSEGTTELLIESAWFEPGTIRRTAKEQNLQTDASYRFERGVDPNLQRAAAERAAALIADISGGKVSGGCSDVHPVPHEHREITLRASYVNRLLGTGFGTEEISEILDGLGLQISAGDPGSLTCRVPSWRPDLEREVDLVEEVGRLYDYNNIEPPSHIRITPPQPLSEWEKLQSRASEVARALRYREIYTNSLMPEADARRLGDLDEMIHTLNPISQDMTTLRPSLLYGFLTSAAYNFNRKANSVRFFEVGHVFSGGEGTWYPGVDEEVHLLMGLGGWKSIEHWNSEPEHYDFFDLKGDVEHMLRQMDVPQWTAEADSGDRLHYRSGGQRLGTLFRIAPALLSDYEIERPCFAAEFSLEAIHEARRAAKPGESAYRPVSIYPPFEFDFAVVVNASVAAGDLLEVIRMEAGESLRDLQVFDVFEGESIGEENKSLAFRLNFVDENKTLTIKDVEPIINKVLKELETRFSAQLRS
ncbi:MAG: phenylalanine--tRNA ligase subunit beta [Balneolaceae bacterium]|nr:phenylalanine--tRNA ligase subunit beta [Balneolaceae bacterium]